MSVIRAAEARPHETPNAVMSTLASPTLGGSQLAVWRVAMDPGASGPAHSIDVEQVWTVLHGRAEVTVAGDVLAIAEGDTIVLPAGVLRRMATAEAAFEALVAAAPGGRALLADGTDRGVPPWME